MPSFDAAEDFTKPKRDLSSLVAGKTKVQTAKPEQQEQKQNGSESERWNKEPNLTQKISEMANNNANSHRSRISRGNHAYIDELWASPSQARLEYNQDNIDSLVSDFLDENLGQMNPIVVCEKVNPDNFNQHLNIISGHNRYLAWRAIYDNPANAHLVNNKAWVDKHRPKVILDDDVGQFDRLIRQVRENVVRDDLSSWEICISACRLIQISKEEKNIDLTALPVLRDYLGVKKNQKKYGALCNIILDSEILEDDDLIEAFAKYKIESPRPAITFFNVYKHAVQKNQVKNLMEWISFVEAKGFSDIVLQSDLQISHFLAELFDDYIPTTDEAVGNAELKRRRNQANQAQSHVAPTQQQVANVNPVAPQQAPSQAYAPQEPAAPTAEPQASTQAVNTSYVQPQQVPSQAQAPAAASQGYVEPQVEQATPVEVAVNTANTQPMPTANQAEQNHAESEQVFTVDTLFSLLQDGSKTEIAEHFRNLLSNSDSMEVGLFIESIYKKLGDDFIEVTKDHFY